LGTNYALVKIPQGANSAAIQANIQKQPYVQNTLPVLTRTNTQETIVLPQEIILRFEPGISESDRQAILQKNNLKLVRALRYVKNFYIVQSNSATGTQVLTVSNQLNQIKGISSATPNFIQSIPTSPIRLDSQFGNLKSQTKQSKEISPALDYLGLQWHINSTPLQQCLQQKATIDALPNCLKSRTTTSASQKSDITRTDLYVSEAWKRSPNKGKDVVVAVIDSLIQWNHPDLQNNIYTVTATDKCPGEKHGWDFSEPPRPNNTNPCDIGDNDTHRAGYSNYGKGLDVVAPGGDTVSPGWFGGIPTTGGTWMEAYWQGLAPATKRWAPVVDTRGKYWWVQGTSFSAPAVSGVVALIKGEDTKKTLNRDGIIKLLESTASYNALTLKKEESELYQTLIKDGVIKPSVSQQQAFFDKGMINAEAALNAIPK
jgi:Subtilase family